MVLRGKDRQFWAGHYGESLLSLISFCSIGVMLRHVR